MKNKLPAAFLAAAMMLGIPGLSHAGAAVGIGASFERDLNRPTTVTHAVRPETDPVQYLVNNALRRSPDTLLAGYERDLNRPATVTYVVRQEVDPVQYLVNNALRKAPDTLLASYERDLDRPIVASTVRKGENPGRFPVASTLLGSASPVFASLQSDTNKAVVLD